jgi:ATP-dependent exoDNAse (exonuclease V) beta subunit
MGDVEEFPLAGAASEPVADVPPAVTQQRRRLPRGYALPALPADVLARGERVPVTTDDEPIEFSWARQTARRVGTVVHEALEYFGRGMLPKIEDLPALRPRLESRLQALGLDADSARAGAGRALEALRATLDDERGRWLFDARHRDAQSELALTGLRANQVINAVIDRTFVDATGTRWVVDFKTSPHEGGNREMFLDEEQRRYEAQLRRYVHLARGLGPEPVKAGLYYPLLTAWREVPLD